MSEIEAFVQDSGLFFERLGLSRTAGRVVGLLLTADPDGADAPELCAALDVAKSSMSVALHRLEGIGLVERFLVAGQRRDRYRLTEDVFARAFRAKMGEFVSFQQYAERGLDVVGDDQVKRKRLQNMRDLYAFMAERFPALLDEWEATR